MLVHRHRFAREQGLVKLQGVGAQQPGIGSDPVALGQTEQVTHHHLLPRNMLQLPVSQHQRARAAQVAQRGDGKLCAALLVEREGQHQQNHHHQRQTLAQVAQHQVQEGSGQQQGEHGLAQGVTADPAPMALFVIGQGIGPILAQSLLSLRRREALGRAQCLAWWR